MANFFLNSINSEIDVPEDVMGHIPTFLVPGAFDGDKLHAMAGALMLASIRSRKISVTCIGELAAHLKEYILTISENMNLTPVISVHDNTVRLDELMVIPPPDLVLLAMPAQHHAMADVLRLVTTRMKEGGCIFVGDFTDQHFQHHLVLPARALDETLRAAGLVPVMQSYFAVYRKQPDVTKPPVPLTAEEQKRCLFCFGHARSGSSIISQIVNEQSDCFMTYEANWFERGVRLHPIDNFNRQQKVYNRRMTKGFFLPETHTPSAPVEDIFRTYLSNYRFFGDKVALGSREHSWEPYAVDVALRYYLATFPFANYVITLRRPTAAIPAQNAIVSYNNQALLMDWWLMMARRLVDLFMVSDRAIIMPFDYLSKNDIRPLERLTGYTYHYPNLPVNSEGILTTTRKIDDYWAEQSPRMKELLKIAESLHDHLIAMIDRETGRLRHSVRKGEVEKLRKLFADASAEAQEYLQETVAAGN